MNFQQLITQNEWLSVEYELVNLYPDEKDNIFLYENIYFQLRIMESKPSEVLIELENCYDEGNGEHYIDVRGKKITEDGSPASYALEFTDWQEWLAMDIAAETLKQFTELEILAHCLYEMTFISFNPEEIQEKFKEIISEAQELKNGSREQSSEHFISWEELKKELGINWDKEEY